METKPIREQLTTQDRLRAASERYKCPWCSCEFIAAAPTPAIWYYQLWNTTLPPSVQAIVTPSSSIAFMAMVGESPTRMITTPAKKSR